MAAMIGGPAKKPIEIKKIAKQATYNYLKLAHHHHQTQMTALTSKRVAA